MRLIALTLSLLLLAACGGSDEAAPTPTLEPTARASEGSIRIPTIDVDAPLTLKRLIVGEALPSPDGPDDVALYDFGGELPALGGTPGGGGNVVLAGPSIEILNCAPAAPPCNGVFAGLRRAPAGAAIELTWRGRLLEYQMVSMCFVPTPQFGDGLYRRTAEEQLTLLTGAGSWSNEVGWSHVLIVIAKPAPRTAVEACPSGTLPGRP